MVQFRIPIRKPQNRAELNRFIGGLVLDPSLRSLFLTDPASAASAAGVILTVWEIEEIRQLLASTAPSEFPAANANSTRVHSLDETEGG